LGGTLSRHYDLIKNMNEKLIQQHKYTKTYVHFTSVLEEMFPDRKEQIRIELPFSVQEIDPEDMITMIDGSDLFVDTNILTDDEKNEVIELLEYISEQGYVLTMEQSWNN
jgi:hypothetical protein